MRTINYFQMTVLFLCIGVANVFSQFKNAQKEADQRAKWDYPVKPGSETKHYTGHHHHLHVQGYAPNLEDIHDEM